MKITLRNTSISRQILALSIGLSLALVICVLGFSVNQILASKNSMKEAVNRNRSFAVVEKIDRNFYERFGDVQAFAFNRLAIETVDSNYATPNAQNFINTMVSYYVLYDLMMILDVKGNVLAVNTTDKAGTPLKTNQLIGEDFSNEEWFRVCISPKGPEGGAWYSDFQENSIVGQIYGSRGRGMAFAAPIRNDRGQVIGVWYNYASWRDVTQGIREETENLLRQTEPNSLVLIMDRFGKVIDAADEALISNVQIKENELNKINFATDGVTITEDDFVFGFGQASGAYTYKGNGWRAVSIVPKVKFSWSIFFGEMLTFTLAVILILTGGMLMFLGLSKQISEKIKKLQSVINSLSLGELTEVQSSNSHDEIGQMSDSVKKLVEGLKKTSLFANEIGNGNLDSSFDPLSEKDVLGHSLVAMRDNLLKMNKEEAKRKWITQGLAELAEQMRGLGENLSGLCDSVVVFLCKYLKANQGALYVKREDNDQATMQLVSCYAWNRKKHLSQVIDPGEGLVGQVWQEAEMIYMTEVPENFVRITSGLGDTNPSSVVIIPLTTNGEVLGILELASLARFEKHELEFLSKVSESLASELLSAQVNDRTRRLLEHTQEQTQALRSQEEEMRQNLEEMQATQEEFGRREKEYLAEIDQLRSSVSSNTEINHR